MAFSLDTLASNIRTRRRALDMSQSELAERAGLTPDLIWNYERANYTPGADKAYVIAEALCCTPDELCGFTPMRGEPGISNASLTRLAFFFLPFLMQDTVKGTEVYRYPVGFLRAKRIHGVLVFETSAGKSTCVWRSARRHGQAWGQSVGGGVIAAPGPACLTPGYNA